MNQSEPSIFCLGVYRVPLDEQNLREELRQYYFPGNAQRDFSPEVIEFIEGCVPLTLFEAHLNCLDERFNVADFTQEMPAAPRKHWQAAYDEAILTPDGSCVLSQKFLRAEGLRSGRLAFYFHFYSPWKPMYWTYGQFTAPTVRTVPQRLWNLLPYNPVD